MIDFASHFGVHSNDLNRLHALLANEVMDDDDQDNDFDDDQDTKETNEWHDAEEEEKRDECVRRSLPTGYLEHGRSVPSAPWTRTR